MIVRVDGSLRSFETGRHEQQSLFDASKNSTIQPVATGGASSPRLITREDRHQKLINDLGNSGARFKCTNCKARKVELELPCAKCHDLNCNADQKKRRTRHSPPSDGGGEASERSWGSSVLNTEYLDSTRRRD